MQRTYPHGVPCWVDTEQPEPGAAAEFYRGLFGWTVTDVAPPGLGESYFVATLDGQDVAAIALSVDGQPPAWHTYVAVDDADAAAARVQPLGGRVAVPPADAGPGGRWAPCLDPLGAPFRLWQARRRLGAQLVNVPGSWNFSDLHTPDPRTALAFYGTLFGWVSSELPGGGTMLQVPGYGDHLAATVDPGIRERQAGAPPGFADVIGGLVVDDEPHWAVTFSVADRDDSVAAAERLGATVLNSAENTWTRTALLRDPQGAQLTVSQFTPPS